MDIQLSLSEIKNMTEDRYKEIIKNKCTEYAYKYLMKKRGSKGQEIKYTELGMSEYLLPNDELNIENQRKIFSMRNRMEKIPYNYSSNKENRKKCTSCEEYEDMEHIYNCEYLNIEEPIEKYEKIFIGNIYEQKRVLERFEKNMDIREILEESAH